MKSRLFLFCCIVQCCYSMAQTSSSRKKAAIDSLIHSEMETQQIPGLSLVVVKNGEIDYVQGYGYANLEHNVPVKPETVFQAGSVGKQFTSFAVMLLVQDGRMSLDDKLTKYFPDAPRGWDSITVRHLLNHTSGFGEYSDDFNYRADYTDEGLYQEIRKRPLLFKAGERQRYSNMGYATLGVIINKVAGKFYGDFLQERVFTPLGMTTARIINEADIIPNRAAGYRMVNNEWKNQEWVSPTINTTADGSLYVTALDMAKWEAGLNAGKLLAKEFYDMMWAPTKLNNGSFENYGFGWSIDSVYGRRILEHNGTWQGFECTIKRYPEEKLAVIVFSNRLRSSTNRIATRILRVYQPELSIASRKTIVDTEPKITGLVNSLIVKTIDKTLTADMFTSEFGPEMIDSTEQVNMSNGLKKYGNFIKAEPLAKISLDGGMREFQYRILFSNEQLELTIRFTKDNKIAYLQGKE